MENGRAEKVAITAMQMHSKPLVFSSDTCDVCCARSRGVKKWDDCSTTSGSGRILFEIQKESRDLLLYKRRYIQTFAAKRRFRHLITEAFTVLVRVDP